MGVKHPCLPESQFIHCRIYTEDLLGDSCHPSSTRYKSDPKAQDFYPLTVYNLMQQSTNYVYKGPDGKRGGSVVKNLPVNAGDTVCHPWVGKIPCRRKWQPTPVFLPGKFHGQRSLVGHSPRGCRESDVTQQPNNNKGH